MLSSFPCDGQGPRVNLRVNLRGQSEGLPFRFRDRPRLSGSGTEPRGTISRARRLKVWPKVSMVCASVFQLVTSRTASGPRLGQGQDRPPAPAVSVPSRAAEECAQKPHSSVAAPRAGTQAFRQSTARAGPPSDSLAARFEATSPPRRARTAPPKITHF